MFYLFVYWVDLSRIKVSPVLLWEGVEKSESLDVRGRSKLSGEMYVCL